MATSISSLGLLLNISGTLLLLFFGLPPRVDPEGHILLRITQVDEKEIAKAKLYKRWSRLGLLLLIAGFVLQIISNYLH